MLKEDRNMAAGIADHHITDNLAIQTPYFYRILSFSFVFKK